MLNLALHKFIWCRAYVWWFMYSLRGFLLGRKVYGSILYMGFRACARDRG